MKYLHNEQIFQHKTLLLMQIIKTIAFFFILAVVFLTAAAQQNRKTLVSIKGGQFYINGELTYKNKYWKGNKIEGLLMNSRMVQGIFDDLNPATQNNFIYPDTKKWDAGRNTSEFVNAMNDWYKHGLLAFTLNLQGGSPLGYGNKGWINSAFDSAGYLRIKYMERLERILNKADELGMVVILGYFYFGQDEQLINETAVINAVDNITKWVTVKGYKNLLIEINNECDINYDHAILKPGRVHELINRVRLFSNAAELLLVSTSFSGGTLPGANVVRNSDYILLHANGVSSAAQLSKLIAETKNIPAFHNQPVIINEDDHFNFESDTSNFVTAVKAYTSWGYFDYRMKDEQFEDGYQSIPVDWGINSKRKKAFFAKLAAITSEEKAINQKQRLLQYIGTWYSADNINDNKPGKNPAIKMTVIPKMDSGSLQVEVFQQQKGKWMPLLVEVISYDVVTDMIVAAGQNNTGQCFTGKGYFNNNNNWFMQDVNIKGEATLSVSFKFLNTNQVYLEGTTSNYTNGWKVKYIKAKK
jgi:hypothetical protein